MDSSLSNRFGADGLWDGKLYRETCSFVPDFGEDLIDLLDPNPGERLLDVGCGTGELSAKLAERGCTVVGLDPSAEMLEEARREHPGPMYVRGDIRTFSRADSFDTAFSNAALHWVQEPNRALGSIRRSLKPGGRFVAEMGANGNVRTVRTALHEELSRIGYNPEERDPWFFPDPDDYARRLEDAGFNVEEQFAFDRPTQLFGEEGLTLWLTMFAEEFFVGLSDAERNRLLDTLRDRLREELYENGQWVLDYRRLRFKAVSLPEEEEIAGTVVR